MFLDFLDMLLYPSLLFIVPFVAVAIMLGVSDYMDSKEDKSKKIKLKQYGYKLAQRWITTT